MSLFTALRSSLTGLTAITSQISVASNNIANASVNGYTEKRTVLTTTSTGGVSISGVVRNTNAALFNSLCTSTSDDGYRSTQSNYMSQIESTLGLTGTNSNNPALVSSVSAFQTAWSALEADPTDSSLRTSVINAAQNLVGQMNTVSSAIDDLSSQITNDIRSDCSDLNSDLQQISDLNMKIAAATSSGQDTGDLQDSRDQLILSVSKIVNITVMNRSQGQVAIYTDGGYCLLDGSTAQTFAYDGTNVYSTLNPTVSLNNTLTGGSLEAAVDFRATAATPSSDSGTNVIQKVLAQLDTFVQSLTTGTTSADFAFCYNTAATQTGESTSFFTGTSTSDFAVNANLVDGTETIKAAAITSCSTALSDSTKSFSGGTLNMTNVSYTTMMTGILSAAQTSISNISNLASTAADSKTYIKESYANATGVNSDSQTVLLSTLENAYAATSHLISVIQKMFDDLETIFS